MAGDEPVIRLGISIAAAPSSLVGPGSGGSRPRIGHHTRGTPEDDRPVRSRAPWAGPDGAADVGVIELAGTIDEFPDPAVLGAIAAQLPESAIVDVQAPRVLTTHPGGSTGTDHVAALASGVDRYALWERFRTSLAPLASARRLGCVIVRLPSEVGPSAESWALLATLPERLPGTRITVETGPGWLAPGRRAETLLALADIGLGYAGPPLASDGTAGPSAPSRRAVCAVVRMGNGAPSGSRDLFAWVRGLHAIVSTAREVHVLVPVSAQGSAAGDDSTGRRAADVPAPPPISSVTPATAQGWHRGHQ